MPNQSAKEVDFVAEKRLSLNDLSGEGLKIIILQNR
jgi:hypothetical protein